MMSKVYKIWCEWDMGFAEAYASREAAQKDIDEADWEDLTTLTLSEVTEGGFVSIDEVEVKD